MSKKVTETSKEKEWTNIDFTNTTGYKTVKAYNKEGVYHGHNELNAPSGGIPSAEYRQLKFLRLLDSKVRRDKGPILKKIVHMHRKVVNDFDQYGKKVSKEYLTFSGEFRGTTWNDEQDSRGFSEGWNKKPIVSKTYKFGKKFDPETGEDLGKMGITGSKLVYYYEVPTTKAERKKFIDSFIENSPGTFVENILYYFDNEGEELGRSDPTFSYKNFVELSIEELKDLSYKGGGSKTPGYYRGPDGKLRNKEGVIIEQMYSEEQKQQVYKKWIDNGRPWFDIDKSKEPTWEERKVILEIKKQENNKSKRDIELEQRAKEIHEKVGKYGKISDKVFDALNNY